LLGSLVVVVIFSFFFRAWEKGTGKVATPEIAQSVHAKCRDILVGMYDQETANKIRILYGGSVTPDSIDDLMAMPDIDGALVGGASLDINKFGRIVNFNTAGSLVPAN
jgi:triosephosphate isomerase